MPRYTTPTGTIPFTAEEEIHKGCRGTGEANKAGERKLKRIHKRHWFRKTNRITDYMAKQ